MRKRLVAILCLGIFISIFYGLSFSQDGDLSLKFDALSQIEGGVAIQSTSYVKGNRVRIEITASGMNSVFLSDGEKAYMYLPAVNTATVIPNSQVKGQLPTPGDYKNIEGLKNLGQEELNGKLCDIYSYENNSGKYKIWVQKDIDYPVKTEGVTSQGKISSIITNIEKDAILSDDLFQLPAGAQVLDMEQLDKTTGGLLNAN